MADRKNRDDDDDEEQDKDENEDENDDDDDDDDDDEDDTKNTGETDLKREEEVLVEVVEPVLEEIVQVHSHDEFESLLSIISDLSRRLQNAGHTVDAQRKASKNSSHQSELYRKRISDISSVLKMECYRNITNQRKMIRDRESRRYEDEKKKLTKLSEEMRMAVLDHAVSGVKIKEPIKIAKMKEKIEKMEGKQDSQRKLLQHMVQYEKITEELCEAAQVGNLEKCMQLIKAGCAVNDLDSSGHSALHYACSKGFSDITRLLIEFGADINGYLTGVVAIEVAARYSQMHIIQILMEFGANIDEKGSTGRCALISAVCGGSIECVNELLKLGADVNLKDIEGNTALHHTASITIESTSQNSSSSSSNSNAIPQKNPLIADVGKFTKPVDKEESRALAGVEIEKLMKTERLKKAVQDQRSIDINASAHEFSKGAMVISATLVKLLLSFGADKLIKNFNGFTPLECALKLGNTAVIDALGGRVNTVDSMEFIGKEYYVGTTILNNNNNNSMLGVDSPSNKNKTTSGHNKALAETAASSRSTGGMMRGKSKTSIAVTNISNIYDKGTNNLIYNNSNSGDSGDFKSTNNSLDNGSEA